MPIAAIARRLSRCQGAAIAFASLVALPAFAGDFEYVDVFRNVVSHQSGDGPTLSDAGAFFSIGAHTQGGTDYGLPGATRTVLMPDATTLTLTAHTPTLYSFQTGGLAGLADMDATYPQGLHTVTLDNGVTAISASFSNGPANHYAGAAPYLAGSGWSSLQGMDATAALTIPVSPFVVDPAASASFEFLTIYDRTSNGFVFFANFLPPTTTDVLLPANTLQPGHSFSYELIYSTRVLVPSTGTNFDAQTGYDLRTNGDFTSAVPEPAAGWLWLAGVAGLMVWRRRARSPSA